MGWVEPLRSVNGYGLFRVMTTERPELVLEGSRDGTRWEPYGFKYKPGDPDRRPGFVAPLHPRLDWQLWFAALSPGQSLGWLQRLGSELAHAVAHRQYAVLTCSALKRRYRDMLRAAVPRLGFVFLELSPAAAAERVAHRQGHFMPASLVDSQFRDLEPPTGEPGVLTVDAAAPLHAIVERAEAWWRAQDAR